MGACHGEAASLCGGGVAGEAKWCAGQATTGAGG